MDEWLGHSAGAPIDMPPDPQPLGPQEPRVPTSSPLGGFLLFLEMVSCALVGHRGKESTAKVLGKNMGQIKVLEKKRGGGVDAVLPRPGR